jgi:methylated-DNA-[protein]-cysteine S-methyltransferase
MDQKLDDILNHGAIETPLGWVQVEYTSTSVKALYFTEKALDKSYNIFDNQVFNKVNTDIKNYFNKQSTLFTSLLNPEGTPFQKTVWNELIKIPYGRTCSYQEIAIKLGGKEKTRAVATAIAKNPILLMIPCHRVIGSNGKLTGFSGGLNRKRVLLELEGNTVEE